MQTTTLFETKLKLRNFKMNRSKNFYRIEVRLEYQKMNSEEGKTLIKEKKITGRST